MVEMRCKMSVELQEARKKLDILEKLASNPELIMTDLFSEGVSGSNFLYQVNVNGKYILDYLVEYLKTLHVFDGTLPKFQSYDLNIYVPALKHGEYKQFQSEDKIMKVNVDKRTYRLCNRDIKKYTEVMVTRYKLETCELSDFWKKYENFTLKNRVKNAFRSLTTDKKLHIRLWDFVFTMIVSKKKIDATLNREIEKVNSKNEYNQKYYNERIDLQNYYIENAPIHITSIRSKQNEIVDYLTRLGYQEDNEMSEY